MTIKEIYIADDDMIFDTKEECLEYEKTKSKKYKLAHDIVAFDEVGDEIKIDFNYLDVSLAEIANEAFHIMFKSKEAANYFDDHLYDKYGMPPISNDGPLSEFTIYTLNTNADQWESVFNKLSYYNKIKELFDKHIAK